MKLALATAGQVVRNISNGSYYRFDRTENSGTRVRIRPLELFPNGLLIAKPTDTVVEADLAVEVVGVWSEGMAMEGSPTRSRRAYENELMREEVRLIVLQTEYEALPTGGKGKLSRGSHANKVKNCAQRISILKRGLGFTDAEPVHLKPAPTEALHSFQARQLVQLPSGIPALILGFQRGGYAKIRLKTTVVYEAAIPVEVLRPWEHARLATV